MKIDLSIRSVGNVVATRFIPFKIPVKSQRILRDGQVSGKGRGEMEMGERDAKKDKGKGIKDKCRERDRRKAVFVIRDNRETVSENFHT
jgi:hypothetical protein